MGRRTHNQHRVVAGRRRLGVWEGEGLVRRIEGKMGEGLDHEAKAAGLKPPDAAKPKTAAKAEKAEAVKAEVDKAEADKTEADDADEAGDEEDKVEKKPRKTGK